MMISFAAGKLDLSHPRVMGILNVTPDSFSDGGRYISLDQAIRQAERLVEEGAAIVDIGGESTRPGASVVSEDEELQRVIPVIEKIKSSLDIPVSIDTSKPQVMRAAVAAGADMINDVCALQNEGALQAAAELNIPVCLMHMQGQPRTMQINPVYNNVVEEIKIFFRERITACEIAGIAKEKIVLDPGFGFGKTLEHNIQLLQQLTQFHELECPLLVGLSRKRMIGSLLAKEGVDMPLDQRMVGSVAAALIAVSQGARLIRVHDVKATADAVRIWQTVMRDIY